VYKIAEEERVLLMCHSVSVTPVDVLKFTLVNLGSSDTFHLSRFNFYVYSSRFFSVNTSTLT